MGVPKKTKQNEGFSGESFCVFFYQITTHQLFLVKKTVTEFGSLCIYEVQNL